ncbi:MAG: hypothetical protein ACRCUT_04430, partial [Spirochaetota bacterium]
IGYDIITDMKTCDADNVTGTIADIVEKFYSLKNADCSVRIDEATTLEAWEQKILIQDGAAPEAAESAPEDNRPEIEKSAQYVVEAKAIISPIHGKRVFDLQKGDKIRLLLANRDGVSLKIAESLKALDDKRNFIPMKGRIVDIVPVEKLGFYIYVAVAKNVLAKITEEGSVQIELDLSAAASPAAEAEKAKAETNIVMYAALLVGLMALAGLLIYAIL